MTDPFNALPEDWASDPVLTDKLAVNDEDEHDDPVLRWPDGRVVDTWREHYPYPENLPRQEYVYFKRPLQVELVKLQNWVLRKSDYNGKNEDAIGEPDKLLIGSVQLLSGHNPGLAFPVL